jgi:maltooligosyltrehalose trehalohydrolase
MLFQGQEFASSNPFLFFADHKAELAKKIREGRTEFLTQFRSLALPHMRSCLPDPAAPATFEASKLDHSEVKAHAPYYTLHRDLLKLRRTDPVFRDQGKYGIDGAVLSPTCWVLRYFSADFEEDRLLLVNLGADLSFDPAPEPLLGPPAGSAWATLWSSDEPAYGGCGTPPLETEEGWTVPGHAAVVLHPISAGQEAQPTE